MSALILCSLAGNYARAQKPAISYQSPQTTYIGVPVAAISVNNSGGAVPHNLNPQTIPLISTNGYFSDIFVITASGDIYTYLNYQIYHVAPDGTSTVFAGNKSGSVDGTGTSAGFDYVEGMTIDAAGNIFVAEDNFQDAVNCKVRKITPAGVVTTYATGLRSPAAITVSGNGIIYVTEGTGRIMKVGMDGTTSLLAGQLAYGAKDGTGPNASFNNPQGLTTDQNGNVYVADFGNSRIRKITPAGVVTTFAGSQIWGATDGQGAAASFFNPRNVACDSKGNILVSDQNNYLMRKIAPDGTVITLAGPTVYDQQNQPSSANVPNKFVLDKNDNIIYLGPYSNQYSKLITTGFSITPALPSGLTFNPDGSISGTPTVLSSAQNYIVRAVNAQGISQAVINLQVVIPTNPPVITSFTPTTAAAGAEITITGSYFTGATGVTIGGKPAGNFFVNTPTSIIATVADSASSNAVTVTNPYGTAATTGFTLIRPPVITSISPTTGWKGSTITITGTNLAGAGNIQIGNSYAASFTVVSSTQIVATVGDASSGSVSLGTPGGYVTFPGFTFLNPPTVSSITPASAAKGDTVTISGTGFANASSVKLGGTNVASFVVVSPTTITAVVGTGASGAVAVTAPPGTGNGSNFNYISPPSISSVAPLTGGVGSSVIINGNNLSNAHVTIGNAPATLVYNSGSQIQAQIGAGATSGNVIVTTIGGTASLPGFIFVAAPQITSFSPSTAAQGDVVTITGTNLTQVSNVSFGNVGATFTVQSPTSIQATVGFGASGSVQAVSPGGVSALPGFTHLGPYITSFTPTQGSPGQSVTINGGNFLQTSEVDFGGVPATAFTVVSANQIIATVGLGASGNVTVTTPKGIGVLYGFVHPGPVITSVSPNYYGPLSTKPVSIIGTNFNNITSVTIGGVPVTSYTIVSSSNITVVPASGSSGNVVITTASGSGKYVGFVWAQPPTITSASPLAQRNGGYVTITGTNLIGVTSVKFGGVSAQFFNNTITGIIAAVGNGASGNISVTTVGGSATFGGFIYTSPVIQSINPTAAAAGQTVTITGASLDSVSSVKFGNTDAASFTIISPQQITAVVGTGASGSVTVTGPRGSGSISGFSFLSPPYIYSFTPVAGGAGTTVSINGQNLLTTSAVTIGGVPATITSATDNLVQVQAGTGATGTVFLTTAAGSAQLDGFTWCPAPVITSVTPISANAQTLVTINGANFTGGTLVSFGGNYVNYTLVSSTQITVLPTFGTSGSITVAGPGGTATFPGFVFIPAPIITSFTKVGEGPGATVTISGGNFTNVSDVELGGVPASSFTVSSPNTIVATSGAGATGLISVTADGGTATIRGFLYQSPPVVSSFSPLSGPIGTTLTITGNNFNSSVNRNVVFLGPIQVTVVSATTTQLVVTVPAAASGSIIVENLDTKLITSSNLPFLITNSGNSATFSNKLQLRFSSGVSNYSVDDFDGDKNVDLLIAKDDSLYILRNSGDKILSPASFSQKIIVATGRYIQSMVVGDVDGDGQKDILISIPNSVVLLHNTSSNGTISFDQQSFLTIPNATDGMSLRDINMDGKPDLIMGGTNPVYYPNTTVGSQVSFGPLMYLANASSSSNISFALADIDGDNKPDPINGSSYTGFAVFQNKSVPGSLFALDFPLAFIQHSGFYYTPWYIAAADFDGDQKVDIIENDFSTNYFLVSRNLATPGNISNASFLAAQSFPCSSYNQSGAIPVDMDGDGKIDLVFTSVNSVAYFPNQSSSGNISFGSAIPLITVNNGYNGNPPQRIKFGDFDGDGRQDMVLIDTANTLTIYSNSPVAVPIITAFTPQSAGQAQKVTITGKYFDGATAVKFGTVDAGSFSVTSSGTIDAIVGSGQSGDISVQTPSGKAVLPGFHFIGPPVIFSVNLPADGSGNITINGDNFTGTTSIDLGGIPAVSFQVVSNTSITAVLSTISSGTLTITNVIGPTTYTLKLNVPAVINFQPVPDHTYGDQDFALPVVSNNTGTPVIFTLNDPSIATISNGTLHILNAGTVTITASQPASGYYQAATSVAQVLNIQKKPLQIKPDDITRPYNTPNPPFTISYTGFANGDDETKLTTKPFITTIATANSVIGTYALVPLGAASNNYNISSTFGVLTIVPELDNFRVAATSVTCKGENNGIIDITTAAAGSYTALVTGNGVNDSYQFTSAAKLPGFAAGSYNVCITDTATHGYQQCFTLNITEPKDLSVYAAINKADNLVTLNLQGGSTYSIHINDNSYSTASPLVTLPLDKGVNKISVNTDKLCQGIFEQTINSGIIPYSNPFQSRLSLYFGEKPLSGMVKIYSIDGSLQFQQAFNNQSGVFNLELFKLLSGVYSLHLIIDNKETVYKVIKQ